MKITPSIIDLAARVRRCLLLIIIITVSSVTCFSQIDNGINIGIIYPVSSQGMYAGKSSNIFSLHAIAGLSRKERAFTAAGFANLIKEDGYGFQVAGFMNYFGGYAQGFQSAGFINLYRGALGFQSAGFANLAKSNVTGVQVAGFMNAAKDILGFQCAGFFNKSTRVRGLQTAGFINTAEEVRGLQVAGFINIAKKVNGVQLAGFINIADSSDYPIGIINIVKNGEKSIGVSTDDNMTTLITFRSGGRKLYSIIGAGYNFNNKNEVYAAQFGIGAHLFAANNFRLNVEVTTISLEAFKRGNFAKSSLSILPALKLHDKIELFAGPGVSYVNTNSNEGKALVNRFAWSDTSSHGNLVGLYVSFTGGVNLKL
jgi:hypothetical protein